MSFSLHVLEGPFGNKKILGGPPPSLTERVQKKLDNKNKPAKLPSFDQMFIQSSDRSQRPKSQPPSRGRTRAPKTRSRRSARK